MGKAKKYGPLAMLLVLGAFAPMAKASAQQGRVGSAAGVIRPPLIPAGWNVVLFDQSNFRGRPASFTGPVRNLPALRPRTRSVTVGRGVWELCSGPNFTGRCVTVARSSPSIGTTPFGFRVRSLRPLLPQVR